MDSSFELVEDGGGFLFFVAGLEAAVFVGERGAVPSS